VLNVSREEIEAIKSQIRRSGSEALIKLTRLTRQPHVSASLRMIRGTQTLLWAQRVLRWCNLLFILSIPLAFVFITPWWWVIAVAALLFVLINLIQGEINLELGARVLVANRKMKID
jgi:hypothetical protein